MNLKSFFKCVYFIVYKRHFFGLTSIFRVFPNFIIIGVGRGGTTSLYHYLSQHYCLRKSAYDEIGFFDTNYDLGILWYKSMFPTIFTKKRILAKWNHFMTYDVTPFYIYNPKVVQRVFTVIPESKIIAILRNPVDKAYSHYNMGVRSGNEKRSFEDAIKTDLDLIDKNKNIPRNDAYFQDVVEKSYIARGFYAEQLEIWMKNFSREQILIISTEDLAKDTDKTLSTIFHFLGLPDYKIKDLTKKNEVKYPPMREETRKMLVNYFRPYNEKLYSLIGKRFDWDRYA